MLLGKFYELTVRRKDLAARPNIFNVSVDLGECEEFVASDINPRLSFSPDLPRPQQAANAFFGDGLPETN